MNYTENLTLKKPAYGDNADVADLNDNADILDSYCYNNRQMEAPPYDPDRDPAYSAGEIVTQNGALYICNTDGTTGPWDATKWDSTTLSKQIELAKQMGGESALADLDDVEITNPSTGQALLFDDSDDKWKNQNLPDVSVTKEASGNPIELTDAASAPMVKCVTEIQGYQEGSGTPSPDNIRPIVAYTEGEIEVSNANPCNDFVFTEGAYIDNSGNVQQSMVYKYVTALIEVEPSTTYTIRIDKALPNELAVTVPMYNADGSFIERAMPIGLTTSTGILTGTFTTTADTHYIRFSVPLDSTKHRIYNTTHTTTYPSAIYRGSEDVVNGEVTETWGMKSYDGSESWYAHTSSNRWYLNQLPTNLDTDNKALSISNQALYRDVLGDYNSYFAFGSTGIYVNKLDSTETLEQFKSRLSSENMVVAYPLATPTTSSVTPTNLPIKSLSGYTHIESSTGDMEVEYITDGYQPLVDLIQSSRHVYSTQEQIVGTWIDGSTIYEKTIYCNGLSGTSDWTELDSSVAYGKLISADGIRVKTNECFSFSNSLGSDPRFQTKTDNKLYYYTNSTVDGDMYITFRYTKSTTTRSLNTSLNTQKAQIEPLTEKEEEVPTEEEKAVNEEENNDETR